jgi:hypothetical protein
MRRITHAGRTEAGSFARCAGPTCPVPWSRGFAAPRPEAPAYGTRRERSAHAGDRRRPGRSRHQLLAHPGRTRAPGAGAADPARRELARPVGQLLPGRPELHPPSTRHALRRPRSRRLHGPRRGRALRPGLRRAYRRAGTAGHCRAPPGGPERRVRGPHRRRQVRGAERSACHRAIPEAEDSRAVPPAAEPYPAASLAPLSAARAARRGRRTRGRHRAVGHPDHRGAAPGWA